MMTEIVEVCSSCGLWVKSHEGGLAMHECDNDQGVAYQTLTLDNTFKQFLDSEEGRFAVVRAQRLIK
jgi:hypothetical protein